MISYLSKRSIQQKRNDSITLQLNARGEFEFAMTTPIYAPRCWNQTFQTLVVICNYFHGLGNSLLLVRLWVVTELHLS